MGAVDTPCWDAAVSSGSQFGPERDRKEVLTWGSICGQPRLARSSHFLVFLRGKKIKIKALSWSPCETALPCEVHPSTLPAWVLINLSFQRFSFFCFSSLLFPFSFYPFSNFVFHFISHSSCASFPPPPSNSLPPPPPLSSSHFHFPNIFSLFPPFPLLFLLSLSLSLLIFSYSCSHLILSSPSPTVPAHPQPWSSPLLQYTEHHGGASIKPCPGTRVDWGHGALGTVLDPHTDPTDIGRRHPAQPQCCPTFPSGAALLPPLIAMKQSKKGYFCPPPPIHFTLYGVKRQTWGQKTATEGIKIASDQFVLVRLGCFSLHPTLRKCGGEAGGP